MEIKEYLAELFADVLEDIIIQTFGDSTAERLKSIFSPDKRKRVVSQFRRKAYITHISIGN